MIFFYHVLTLVVFFLCLPFLPFVWMFSAKRRANLLQRLGVFTRIPEKETNARRIWVHALSVGEVNSSVPLVTALKKKYPAHDIVFTASTKTGFERALDLMNPDRSGSAVATLGYFPFDIWFSVNRVASRISPDIVCLVETDLWPGFLSVVHQRGIPVVLVNARLSPRSLKGYQRMGSLASLFFSTLSCVMAQSFEDASGFEQLGVAGDRILVTGNIKYDQPCPALSDEDRAILIRELGFSPQDRIWIAGSTHSGEESMVIRAFIQARQIDPGLKLVIAPRDPGRCPALLRELPLTGFKVACYLDHLESKKDADIMFVNTIGILARTYAVCVCAFVGGSLVARGGHNLLEPAMFGKPVLFGPHMTDFRDMARLFIQGQGGIQVEDEKDLVFELKKILQDSGHYTRTGHNARQIFNSNSGAINACLRQMEGVLD
ncbi:3-deoxy-D-manno-octulosonic acid transferase [uncultured Desulfobacter sp.]|uniref:3-deoxy-D-manno-octulosonic acid transferase n=1 Tax=uncultured Desulfobacter sp. TaxID=240139 RepID=UPI002AAB9A85|nr:3-deoxy-D-manno-octulosonic acid transferase [uncultured Desulfobacter sp.]